MTDYKSVQDLIIKAAKHDNITTTIRRNELIGARDVIEIIFSKDDRYSATNLDLHNIKNVSEEMALYSCKNALRELLWKPYEEIEVVKENTK